MNELKQQYIMMLKLTSKILESLTDEQCINILNGTGRVKYEDIIKEKKVEEKLNSNLLNYIDKIKKFKSREEAYSFIQSLNLKKKDLTAIAQQLKIHVSKNDRKDDIVKKIMEITVGSKLTNEAIMNTDLKQK